MTAPVSFEEAVAELRSVHSRWRVDHSVSKELSDHAAARDEVLARYQALFSLSNLENLTAEEFRQFLLYKNNRHWMSLPRLGPAICADMDRLREALRILLDDTQPIRDRLNRLIPHGTPNFVPRLGKAVITPILLITHPDRYGVWNSVSEAALKQLGLWPQFGRSEPFGARYERVNDVLNQLARQLDIDLWTLDSLMWAVTEPVPAGGDVGGSDGDAEVVPVGDGVVESQRFGLERHLHEFLRDNWDKTTLGKEWMLYQEDGDPEAGYEYPCDVGRIDLLARHKKEKRWLVIELKRNQSSDQTVGQVARYIGWVKQHLAVAGESVEGLVISHAADLSMRYALSAIPSLRLELYEVQFQLRPAPAADRAMERR